MEEDDIGVQVQKKISSNFMLQGTSSWCAVLLHGPNDAFTGIHVRKASAYESFSIYVDPVDLPKVDTAPMAKQLPKFRFILMDFPLYFGGGFKFLVSILWTMNFINKA